MDTKNNFFMQNVVLKLLHWNYFLYNTVSLSDFWCSLSIFDLFMYTHNLFSQIQTNSKEPWCMLRTFLPFCCFLHIRGIQLKKRFTVKMCQKNIFCNIFTYSELRTDQRFYKDLKSSRHGYRYSKVKIIIWLSQLMMLLNQKKALV